ncbi:hypothetical protein [Brachybacterium sacelli]|uniref:Uncharacterized protein n=1 Tax=Brachybacterium sacelli TaxID=173364 RepID=A0ABS4WVB1_9MICO|nr:hypothetical protein [Brachybacterium sacelli]MBP2380147.1 hypothetical protein [Brachybacterium sacelli]
MHQAVGKAVALDGHVASASAADAGSDARRQVCHVRSLALSQSF